MFTFSVVKKIGEGSYLDEALFIIERVRRERALNMHRVKIGNKHKHKSSAKDGKGKSA